MRPSPARPGSSGCRRSHVTPARPCTWRQETTASHTPDPPSRGPAALADGLPNSPPPQPSPRRANRWQSRAVTLPVPTLPARTHALARLQCLSRARSWRTRNFGLVDVIIMSSALGSTAPCRHYIPMNTRQDDVSVRPLRPARDQDRRPCQAAVMPTSENHAPVL